MRRIRVIPALLLNSSGGLVKTVGFGKRTYIGDPINAVKIFNEKGVDELVLLDIDAAKDGREPNFEMIEDIASEAFMPIGYGGGISSVDQMALLFRCGLEKVIVSTTATENPGMLREASDRFGAQSVVVCLDVRKTLLGKSVVTIRSNRTSTKMTPVEAATKAVENGAGELIVYSINRDGSYRGYDEDLLQSVAQSVEVPVIASGGARDLSDFYSAVAESGCSAVSAGSMFFYHGKTKGVLISYPSESELTQLYERLES
jgi:cyclase